MKAKHKCETKYCRRERPPQKKKCWTCQKKAWKKKYPVRYAYSNLKQNAKKRKKDFTLSLEQFEEFCKKTSYLEKVGKKRYHYSIDRIRSSEGYHIDNIQLLTVAQNSSKKDKLVEHNPNRMYEEDNHYEF